MQKKVIFVTEFAIFYELEENGFRTYVAISKIFHFELVNED